MSASIHLRQVLYVEDQLVNVLLMEAIFRLRPHLSLVVATDCAEARALMHRIRPDLLLDLCLPDGHGSDLLLELRQQAGWRALGAVAVTSEPGADAQDIAFDEVWPKPLDLPMVLERLDKWLPPLQAIVLHTLRNGLPLRRRLPVTVADRQASQFA